MKVLYLVEEYGGGGARWHRGLFSALREQGVEISVVNLNRSRAFRDAVGAVGVEVTELGAAGDYWRALPRLRGRMRRSGADLVHGIELIPSFYGAVARRLLPTPRPPLIYGKHHMAPPPGWGRFMDRVAFAGSARVFTVSEEARRVTLEEHPGSPDGKVVAIHNGISPAGDSGGPGEEALFRRLEEEGRPFTVLLLARLRPEKGHDVALAAAERLRDGGRDVRWIFAGDGPLAEEIDEEVARRGLDGVVLRTGRVADVGRLLEEVDALVAPSRAEAFGLSAIEAMAAGLPVVAARIGGLTEVVEDGETGILVPSEDAGALAAAVERLAVHPDEARRLGWAGLQRYRRQFTPEAMAEAHLREYRKLLEVAE